MIYSGNNNKSLVDAIVQKLIIVYTHKYSDTM